MFTYDHRFPHGYTAFKLCILPRYIVFITAQIDYVQSYDNVYPAQNTVNTNYVADSSCQQLHEWTSSGHYYHLKPSPGVYGL